MEISIINHVRITWLQKQEVSINIHSHPWFLKCHVMTSLRTRKIGKKLILLNKKVNTCP